MYGVGASVGPAHPLHVSRTWRCRQAAERLAGGDGHERCGDDMTAASSPLPVGVFHTGRLRRVPYELRIASERGWPFRVLAYNLAFVLLGPRVTRWRPDHGGAWSNPIERSSTND